MTGLQNPFLTQDSAHWTPQFKPQRPEGHTEKWFMRKDYVLCVKWLKDKSINFMKKHMLTSRTIFSRWSKRGGTKHYQIKKADRTLSHPPSLDNWLISLFRILRSYLSYKVSYIVYRILHKLWFYINFYQTSSRKCLFEQNSINMVFIVELNYGSNWVYLHCWQFGPVNPAVHTPPTHWPFRESHTWLVLHAGHVCVQL